MQSAGLSGSVFQSPAEEDARGRKDNHVCGEGRGLAGLQMSLSLYWRGGACLVASAQTALGHLPLRPSFLLCIKAQLSRSLCSPGGSLFSESEDLVGSGDPFPAIESDNK